MNNLKKPLVFKIEKILRTDKYNNLENFNKNFRFKITKARSPWSKEEDQYIINLVSTHGTKNWTLIASEMAKQYQIKNRTGKQCRERWHNHLDPNINKNYWTDKEEAILFIKHMEFGNKWSEIANFLPGRSDNCVKNHFYSKLRKFIRKILKQLNKDNCFKTFKIDSSKYNSEKIYRLIKKNKLPYNTLTKEGVLELILKNDKNNNEKENVTTNKKIIKRISRRSNKNRQVKIKTKKGKYFIIIYKNIFSEKDSINNPSSYQKVNEGFLSNQQNDYNQPKNFSQNQTNFLVKNKNTTLHSPEEELKISFQNSTRGMLQLPENPYSYIEKNLFEMYKPTISPINYLNNNQGMLFPIVPTTNKSYNLNLENYVQKQHEVDPLCVNNSLPGFITNNLYENNNIFNNNVPINFSSFTSNFQPFYHNQFTTFISPSNSRGLDFQSTSGKEVNIQNKILINELSEDPFNRLISTSKAISQNEKQNQSDALLKARIELERRFSFGNHENVEKAKVNENLRNEIDFSSKENNNNITNSFRLKKNALPKLDIENIKSSETFKIFNESLNNPYNLEVVEEMINNHFSSNNGRSSLNVSPLENINFIEQNIQENKEKIKDKSSKNNLSVKEINAIKFNISPKSAFLVNKKN